MKVVSVGAKLKAEAEMTTSWEMRRESWEVHEVLTCIACGQDGSQEATLGSPNRAKTVCDQASARL